MSVLIKALDEPFISSQNITVEFSEPNSISNTTDETLDSLDIPNYLSFDGLGLDLISQNKKFYESGDYVGYISQTVSPETTNESWGPSIRIYGNGEALPAGKIISIEFYDNCCVGFDLEALANSVWQPYDSIKVNSGVGTIDGGVLEDTYQIRFNNFQMSEGSSFLKITSISIGGIRYFNKFKNISLFEEINVLSDDLPMNSFNVDIITDDFSFVEDSALNVISNGRNYGTFYIDEIERIAKNIYSLTCYNSIKKLDNVQHENGTSGWLPVFLSRLSTLAAVDIESSENVKAYGLWGNIPINSARYALSRVAFVCNLMVKSSRMNKIVLKSIPTEISSHIYDDRIIGDAVFTKEKVITAANYKTPFGYTFDTPKSIELDNVSSRTKYIYQKPAIFKTSSPEITIYEQSDNYIDFESPETITTITIQEYIFNTVNVSIPNPLASATAKPNTVDFDYCDIWGVKTVDDETVKIDKTSDIQKYIQSRGKVKAKIILEHEQVGDLIQIHTAYDETITGIITSMDIHFGYRDIAEIEVLEWSL